MKEKNIIKKLEQDGYHVENTDFHYWTCIKVDKTKVAQLHDHKGTLSIQLDFKYQDVINAIEGGYNDMNDFYESNY